MDIEKAWATLGTFDDNPAQTFEPAILEAGALHLADMEEQGREDALRQLREVDERHTLKQHLAYLDAVFTIGRALVAAH